MTSGEEKELLKEGRTLSDRQGFEQVLQTLCAGAEDGSKRQSPEHARGPQSLSGAPLSQEALANLAPLQLRLK